MLQPETQLLWVGVPSCYSSRRLGPKTWPSLPGSCSPQALGSLMWVSALADTMKRRYMLLPGCSARRVNPKSSQPWGEVQPQPHWSCV